MRHPLMNLVNTTLSQKYEHLWVCTKTKSLFITYPWKTLILTFFDDHSNRGNVLSLFKANQSDLNFHEQSLLKPWNLPGIFCRQYHCMFQAFKNPGTVSASLRSKKSIFMFDTRKIVTDFPDKVSARKTNI